MTTERPPASAIRAAFLIDDRELTPEIRGADRHRLPGDPGQRLRRTEDVDDVHGNRHVGEALEALLPEDFRLARVDRNDAVPVPPEVEPDEIAGAQLILRQPDDRDGLCACGSRAGSSADPDSGSDRMAGSSGRHLGRRRRGRRARSPVRDPRSDRRRLRCRQTAGSSPDRPRPRAAHPRRAADASCWLDG